MHAPVVQASFRCLPVKQLQGRPASHHADEIRKDNEARIVGVIYEAIVGGSHDEIRGA